MTTNTPTAEEYIKAITMALDHAMVGARTTGAVEIYKDAMKAVQSLKTAAGCSSVPDGYALVPVDPTDEIIENMREAFNYDMLRDRERKDNDFYAAYKAITVGAVPSVPEWMPIETAPKDGTEIMGWDGETSEKIAFGKGWDKGIATEYRGPCWGISVQGSLVEDEGFDTGTGCYKEFSPTHWKHLDQGPKDIDPAGEVK